MHCRVVAKEKNEERRRKSVQTNAARKNFGVAMPSIVARNLSYKAHCMTTFLAKPNKHYLSRCVKHCSARFQYYTTDMPAKKKKGAKSKRPSFDPEIVTGAKEKKVEGLLIFEHCVS